MDIISKEIQLFEAGKISYSIGIKWKFSAIITIS